MGNENGRTLSAEEIKSREAQANAAAKQPKGNTYKLKVVIKGDRNTGKTCLWNILQRKPFSADYQATSESQSTCINWEYKASYDIITVEVWDVVDKTKRKVSGLKVSEADGAVEEDPNVMRGVHAVVFVVDPTKKWTFDYVIRELPKVPSGLSTLLLANFKDQHQKWTVTPMEMRSLIESAGPHARYLEVSLANSFGLKGLQLFLNLPFLRLRHAFYEAQMKKCLEEMDIANQEFEYVFQESDYERYTKWLNESKKGQVAVASTQPTTPKGSSAVPIPASPAQKGAAPAAKAAAGSAPVASSPKPAAPSTPKGQAKAPATPFAPSTAPTQKIPPKPETPSSGGGFFSRLFGSDPAPPPAAAKTPAAPQRDVVGELKQMAKKKGSDFVSVDDFKPDAAVVDDFFGPDEDGPVAPRGPFKEESSSDDEANDLVGDEDVGTPQPPSKPAAAPLSSSAKSAAKSAAPPAASAPPTSNTSPATAAAATAAAPTAPKAVAAPASTAAKAPALTDSGRAVGKPAAPVASPASSLSSSAGAPARSATTSPPSSSASPSPSASAAPAQAARAVTPPAPVSPKSAPVPAPAAAPVAAPAPARPSAVDDFRPDDASADDFFSSPAPAPKPAAPKAVAPVLAAVKAETAPVAAAPAAPKQKFEESDSDDDNKPNPFLIPDEDVGDDSVAIQKKAATASLPKSTTASLTAKPLTSWRQPAVEAKPAPAPQPKIAIDINALVAGFLQDDEPAPSSGFESIPEDGGAPVKKKAAAKKKKSAAAATSAEGAPAAAPKKKAGVKKKKAAATAAPAEEDE